jgi:hypothetical protein
VGLAYYRIRPEHLESLRSVVIEHEMELVGPRSRGYWFDRPEDYDYEGVRRVAQELDEAGKRFGVETLELSEVQAHALTLLEMELPQDDNAIFAPSLFLFSSTPAMVRRQLSIARRKLGESPETVRLAVRERDPRFAGYLGKQVRHLREALPLVWHFYERADEAGDAVLVVDLRARDLDVPESFELAAMLEG